MPDSDVVAAAQSLALQGFYWAVDVDVGQWVATVSALRGLRHLKLGSMDEQMLPALSSLPGLTFLHLGIRHSRELSLVSCCMCCTDSQCCAESLSWGFLESNMCVSPQSNHRAYKLSALGQLAAGVFELKKHCFPSQIDGITCCAQAKPLMSVIEALVSLVELQLTIALKARNPSGEELPEAPPGVHHRPPGMNKRHTT